MAAGRSAGEENRNQGGKAMSLLSAEERGVERGEVWCGEVRLGATVFGRRNG
jgi:hypothetical protein